MSEKLVHVERVRQKGVRVEPESRHYEARFYRNLRKAVPYIDFLRRKGFKLRLREIS